MNKAQLQAEAVKLFAIHPNIDKLYITQDGHGFTDNHRANDHARVLGKDRKKVFEFDRNIAPEVEQEPTANDDANRESLAKEYEVLFGKAPAHNAKAETLVVKIAEKKAELAEAEKNDDANPNEGES